MFSGMLIGQTLRNVSVIVPVENAQRIAELFDVDKQNYAVRFIYNQRILHIQFGILEKVLLHMED